MEKVGGRHKRKRRRPARDPQEDGISPFDLEKAISEWTRGLRRSESIEDGAIAELVAHVRDEVEDLVGQGKSPEEAFSEAMELFEGLEAIGTEYTKTRARGILVPSSSSSPGGFSLALFLDSIKVSFRKVRRHKWYSLITVTGRAAAANPVDSLRYE